jgi:molybdate transport system substrate-binding protein
MQNMHKVMRLVRAGVVALLCGLPLLSGSQSAATGALVPKLHVAAASNLKFVMDDLLALYQKQTARELRLTLGASGHLAQQIRQGLPVALFLSADEERVNELFKAGLTQDAGQVYGTGRLALVVPKESRLPLEAGLKPLVLALKSQDKFAIASPDLAPYGLAAQEALAHEGVWQQAKSQLVKGENIAQTMQFVVTGSAQAGITALSMVMTPEVIQRIRYKVIPKTMHAPIRQKLVVLKGAGPEASDFRDFLLSRPAQEVFRRHGYDTAP